MTEKEVRDAVRAWLAEVMGAALIHSHGGGTAPAEPYGVLNLTMSDALYANVTDHEYTVADEGLETETITEKPVRDWYWRFSLNVYGGEGSTILRTVKTAEKNRAAMAALHPLTLFETSIIRNVPELLNEEWQARAQMDIEIRGLVRDGYVIDVAETAAVETTSV